jgi:uncharacterized protein YgiB involved in biofilm formation
MMKRTKTITLCLISNVVLVSCEDNKEPVYKNIEDCQKKLSLNVCQRAYDKALLKDKTKTSMTQHECERQYKQCVVYAKGYAPVMDGFLVCIPEAKVLNEDDLLSDTLIDGKPHYALQHKATPSRWSPSGLGSLFGSKPRSGGFGNSGCQFGG